MAGTAAALATILLGAGLLGHGLLKLCGAAWSWTAPAVGLAAAIVAAALAIRLPGAGVTAALLLAALVVGALAKRPRLPPLIPVRGATLVGVIVLASALIPFVVNGRFGLLGISFNDDASRHLLAVEYLRRDGNVPESVFGLAYPSGPHALLAVVATGIGVRADQALDGLLMTIPLLT